MQPTILGDFVDDLSRSREPGGVRGEARRPGLARPRGRAGALARSILRPSPGEPKAGCASRRPPESLRPAPCEPPAPGQNRPAGLPVALARAVAPARHAAAAFLVVFAALLAVSTTAQAQTTGICGRTVGVRTAILGKISGVSNCANVTDAHLAAITGTLDLNTGGVTALAAGDFDGLTALTVLELRVNQLTTLPDDVFDGLTALTGLILSHNSLTTLPAGVFDELTALTRLYLDGNSLSTLRAGVFDELTSLTSLYLYDNSLTTLPAGVFEPLTSLTRLELQGNSGAPFSPTAVAVPDDGEVPSPGGTATLDGSGSGGPWGTNVTYGWALTSPTSGVTVTFDDAASATPVVTIPALTAGTELTFTLTVTGRATDTSQGTAPDTDARGDRHNATVTATATTATTNAAPAFTSSATFSAAENQTAAGTVEASDSDTGDSVTGYAIQGGADRSKFSIGAASGVLTFRSAPNFEDATDDDASNTYVVVVRATSGTGAREKTEDQTITVTVTDVDGEAPGVPGAPTVSSASVSSLTAAWAAPANAGPPITDYDYRYQVKSTPGWTEVTNTTSTALSATITGLAEDTEYEVQVRATNDEGTSGWSDPGSASTATTPGVTVSTPALTVTEDDTAGDSYTVVLDSRPTADVTVSIGGTSGTDLSLNMMSLTFTTSNWNVPQTVTVSAARDSDATHDRATLTHTATGGDYGTVSADLPVTVTDITRMRLVAVVDKDKQVSEGESMPIRAMLPMPLDDDVSITVTVAPHGGRDDEYELSANTTLTIAAGTTESTGNVVFTSLDDFTDTGTRNFDATLTPDHPRVDARTERFAVLDDDNTVSLLQVTPPKIFENGGTATLRGAKLRLHEGVVKMAVSLEPSDRATLSSTTLTFQPGALYATETLTITAVDNAATEGDQTITISATVTEGRGIRTPAPVRLTIEDDEGMSPEVALVLTPPRVREGLASTVTAVASGPLSAEATIMVSASPAHSDTRMDDYVLSANTVLTIPSGGTRSTGTVTIATADDQFSGGSRRRWVTVSGTVTGGGVANPENQQLVVLEDDQQVRVAVIATPATLAEGEVSTITLSSLGQPLPADVMVTIRESSDEVELSADPVLMIAEGETESTGTVTLTAVQDTNMRNGVVTVSGVPDNAFVRVAPAYVSTVDDDATAPFLTVSPVPSRFYEGQTSTIIAALSQTLSNTVTVTIGVDEAHVNHSATADDYTLSGNLTLTIPAGEMRGMGPTLTASNDEYFGPPQRQVVLDIASVTGIDRLNVIKHSDWYIFEDEEQPRVTLETTPASIPENGGQSTVTAKLNTKVAHAVKVTISAAAVGTTESDDFTQNGTQLTIPANAKASTGTVTITGVDDDVDGPDKNLVVAGTATVVGMETSGLVWDPYEEYLTIRDDDTRGVTVSPETLRVNEGSTGTYMVVLNSQPTASVTVTPSSDNSDVAVSSTLTFTTMNWNTAQAVTVTAAQDSDAVDGAATISHAVMGGDYGAVTAASVAVTVDDDEVPDTTAPTVTSIVRQTPASSPTNANSLTWRVTFSEAVSNVDATDFAVSGTTATLTVAAVSGVTGAYDVTASGGNLADLSATVTLSFATGQNIQDAANNALTNTAPTGTNDHTYVLDNTAPTVTITGVPGTSSAPFTATFTFSEAVTGFVVGDITLDNATASNFTVTSTTVYTALITPTADGTVTVDVEVNVAQDAIGNDNTAATQASSTYTAPVITIAAGTSPVTEGTSAAFALSRAGSTTAALTVNATVSETGGDMVAPATEGARTVTFQANSATATLSVPTVADQVDEADGVVTATVTADTATPATYTVGTPSTATVTVSDDDTRGVTVSAETLPVNEGSTGTYMVVLNSQPTASVTVTPSSDNSDVAVSSTLTFTTTNWNTAQTVTVTAAQDSDAVDDAATISHAVMGGDYGAVTAASVAVTVDDDEVPDTTAPRVTSIMRQTPASSPTNANSLTWRVTFSEAVSNVDATDFAVSGTTATLTVAAVSGVTGAYDVTASEGNLAGLSATVTLSFATGQNIQDAANITLTNTAPTGTNDHTYVLDNTAPTVTITGVPGTSSAPFTATFTFSEAVTGFVVGDITLDNATASNFTVTSTTVYTALITPTAYGTVTVDVEVNVAQDAVGNDNTAATQASSTYTAPVITIAAGTSPVTEGTSAAFALSRAGSTTAELTVNATVSETGGDMVGPATEGARTVTFQANSATATLSVPTVADQVDEADGVVTATVTADTENPATYTAGTPSTATVTVSDDDTRGVTVSPETLPVNEGSTGTYTVVLNSQPTASVTVTPSSDNSDVAVSSALTFTTTNWNMAQTVTVTAAQDSDAVDDAATISHAVMGGDYGAVTAASVAVTVDDDEVPDTTAPTVISIVRQTPASSPTNANSLTWRVTFSEAVSNVDATDFAVSGTTATLTVAAVSGVTGAYDVTASGGNLAGLSATVTLSFATGQNIQDAANITLTNTAPTGTNDHTYVLDNTAPTVTITGVPGTSSAPFTATFTFSEAVTGFVVGDITLDNATASNFTVTSTTVYTALITPTAYGTVTVDVAVNVAQDAAGNDNTAATQASSTYSGRRGPSVPGAPASLTATAGDEEVALVWSAPADDGGSPVTGYEYRFAAGTTVPGDTPWQSAGLDLEWTVTGLTNGQQYAFEVRASNRVGEGEARGALARPVGAPGALASLTATAGDEEVALVWSAPADDGGSPVTGYEYRFAAGTTVPGDTPWQSAGLDLEWTVTGLTNGQQYAFEVRASNRVGEGEARGALATPVGAPEVLASLTATAGDEEVALVWSAPADDGGAPITGYEYRHAAGTTVPGDTPWQSAGLDLEWTVTGLTNGQQYAFEVRASNRAGEGEARGALATPVGAPEVLASLTATAGDEEVALVWSAPADDGGSPVTGYGYRYAAGQAVPEDVTWRDAGTELTATVSGLENETRYTFEVRARNRVGPGETSGTTALPLRLRAELFSSAAAAEGEALVVGVRRSGRLAFPAHAYIGVTDSALPGVTATEEGRDDGLGRHRLEFAAGAAEATVTVTVAFDGERRQDRVLSATLDSAELEVDGVRRPYELVTPTLVVPVTEGDAALSVADARVQGKSSVLAFTVSLDRTRDVAVRVDYATEDGSARAGEDYTPVSGTLTIEAGGRERTVEVPVLPALHVTGERTLTLRLSNAVSAVIDDGVASGVIVRESELPKAWLARFGRTASDHAAQAIARRLEAGQRETQVTVAGRRVDGLSVDGLLSGALPSGGWRPASAVEDMATRLAAPALAASGAPFGGVDADPGTPGLRAGTWGGAPGALDRESSADAGQTLRRAVLPDFGFRLPGAEEALLGTSFYVERGAQQDVGGGTWAAWGDVAATRFEGDAGGLALNGDVVTGTAGLDRQWRAVLVGLALSRSSGEGGYGTGAGTIASTLTSVHPYVQVRLGERAQVWGAAGWGRGGLEITPESGAALEADLRNSMAAAGARAVLMGAGGLEIALRSDFLWTETASDGTAALAEAVGTASRGRLMLEGAGQIQGLGGVVRPKVEGGVRYDGGDAETGRGFEVGGGLDWARGSLTLQLSGRMLVAHADESYEEWGYSGSLVYEPGTDGLGLQMRVGSSAGAAASGIRNLWALENASGLVRGGAVPFAQRFDAEVGYGLGRGTLWYPYFVADDSGQTRYGLKLSSGRTMGVGLEFGRRESVDLGPEDAMLLRGELRF